MGPGWWHPRSRAASALARREGRQGADEVVDALAEGTRRLRESTTGAVGSAASSRRTSRSAGPGASATGSTPFWMIVTRFLAGSGRRSATALLTDTDASAIRTAAARNRSAIPGGMTSCRCRTTGRPAILPPRAASRCDKWALAWMQSTCSADPRVAMRRTLAAVGPARGRARATRAPGRRVAVSSVPAGRENARADGPAGAVPGHRAALRGGQDLVVASHLQQGREAEKVLLRPPDAFARLFNDEHTRAPASLRLLEGRGGHRLVAPLDGSPGARLHQLEDRGVGVAMPDTEVPGSRHGPLQLVEQPRGSRCRIWEVTFPFLLTAR